MKYLIYAVVGIAGAGGVVLVINFVKFRMLAHRVAKNLKNDPRKTRRYSDINGEL